ncbi:NAD(P)/FAD-dependent oxidoreductase [Dermatophilaceae bacterium Soc4.6]
MTTPASPTSPTGPDPTPPEHLDVVIVGAGVSGVDMAYRLQESHPHRTYAILEGREQMGGTWDLFRYPGIRSDSDIFTFGFPFKPWEGDQALAGGTEIREYVQEAARDFGIDAHIRYRTQVVSTDWDRAQARWVLSLDVTDASGTTRRTLTAGFVVMASGYYRYDAGYTPDFAGRQDFAGQVVHPQHWPQDLDVRGKKVVVIGSGATAVTLVPALAELGADVTMLQRTPSWIVSIPSKEKLAASLRGKLPAPAIHRVLRAKNIGERIVTYWFCRTFPTVARRVLSGAAERIVGQDVVAEHFTPTYNPWDQRVCAAPSGDFYTALRDGRTSVVTDHIDRFVTGGIQLKGGRTLEADVIVTATGLQLQAAGGIEVSVDGRAVDLSQHAIWRGALVSGLPNLAMVIGYVNSSWTLRADLTARLVCKVLAHMDANGLRAVAPVVPAGLGSRPVIDLKSNYVARSIGAFPHAGDRRPWTVPQNYVVDRAINLGGKLEQDLEPYEATPARELARSVTG